MSGGFFRGTSADQDTRFSNKTAKLLKTQKFAPELDQLVDMGKINMNVMRPWIANRVTQLMGFEDEVLINFVYGLLEGKNVDGKQIQINLTGFMEKNTGKFMRELWGLLTSAQNSMNGIPQQFLDEKAEEIGRKKAEEQRVLEEIQRKEEEKKGAEQELLRKENLTKTGENIDVPTGIKRSSPKGSKSPNRDGIEGMNGTTESRRPRSRSRSDSHNSNKSISRSPRRRRGSRSVSRTPPQLSRRSRSPPGRGRSPTYRRSKSPVRRGRSPIDPRSPRRRRRSPAYSRSPRRRRRLPAYSPSPRSRSPIGPPRSPRRGRLSPIHHSPRRRRSPVYSRSSPIRTKSPPRTPPRYRRRSPVYGRSPPRRYTPASPPRRNRRNVTSPKRPSPKRPSPSPQRRPLPQLARRASRLPSRLPSRSLSLEASSRSPPIRVSPPRHVATSPGCLPPLSSSLRGTVNRSSPSPRVQHRPLPDKHSRSPGKAGKAADNRSHRTQHHSAPERDRTPSPSLSPERRHGSRSSLEASPGNGKSTAIINKKRTRSLSRESSLSGDVRQAAPSKKATGLDDNAAVLPTVNYQGRKQEEPHKSVSKSSEADRQMSPGVDRRSRKGVESDDNESDHGNFSPINLDDRKAVKRRRKEERRLYKEEKRRKREERHRRKEEKRASKGSFQGVASVTPPPDLDERMMRTDNYNRAEVIGGEDDDEMEIEQRRLENELRKKALDSIKAKKAGGSSS